MPVSVQEFATKIKQKYPQYQSVDDQELALKMIEKYPQYKSQVNFGSSQQSSAGGEMPSQEEFNSMMRSKLGGLGKSRANQANFAAQAGGEMAKGLGNTLKFGGDLLQGAVDFVTPKIQGAPEPFKYNSITNTASGAIEDAGNQFQQGAMDTYGGAENDPSTWLGKLAGQVANFAVGGGAGSKAAQKGLSLFPKIGEGANAVANMAKNKTLRNAIMGAPGFVANSLGSTAGASVAGKGRMASPEELTMGLGVDSALGGLGAALKKGSNLLYSSLIPSTIKQRGKDMARNLDIGDALRKVTGIQFNRGGVLKSLENPVKNLSQNLDESIEQAIKTGAKPKTFDQLTKGIETKVLRSKKLQIPEDEIAKAQDHLNEVMDFYRSKYRGKTLDLKEQQQVKKSLGNNLSREYAKAESALLKTKPLARMELASSMRKNLEKAVPEAKDINKQLAPLLEAKGRIMDKGPYSGYLTDVIAGAAAGGDIGELFNNPGKYIRNALTGIATKRLATSTLGKTTAGKSANFLSNLFGNQNIRNLLKGGLLRNSKIGN